MERRDLWRLPDDLTAMGWQWVPQGFPERRPRRYLLRISARKGHAPLVQGRHADCCSPSRRTRGPMLSPWMMSVKSTAP